MTGPMIDTLADTGLDVTLLVCGLVAMIACGVIVVLLAIATGRNR